MRHLHAFLIGMCLAGGEMCLAGEAPGPSPAELEAFGPIQPRLSPQSRDVAFSWQGSICRLDLGSGAVLVLTAGERFDVEPAWSPDEQSLAFVTSPNFGWGQLRRINAVDGATLPVPTVNAQGPLWFHPDGRRLLGRFSRQGPPNLIAWLDLEGGELTPLPGVSQSVQFARAPFALSRDGQNLLYAIHQDQPNEQSGNHGPHADLYLLPIAGGAPRKLMRWPARIYHLSWSGTTNAFHFVSDFGASHNDIWQAPVEQPERGAVRLTTGGADEDAPSSSADGRWLVYTDNSAGSTALVLRDLVRSSRRTLPLDALVYSVAYREDNGTLELSVVDQATGQPAVARVSIRRKGGKFFAPVGALYRVAGGRMHFHVRRRAALELPAGDYEITATRGPEYRVWQQTVEVRHGSPNEATVALQRWTDAWSRGWFSGENHIHANYGYGAWYNTPRSVLDMCEGEDLNVANLVVANSDGEGVFDREFFRGGLDPLSTPRNLLYWNQEFRSTFWGHMTLGNLPRLVEPIFTGFRDTTNPWDIPTNADIAGRVRDQGGVASYTHPANQIDDPYAGAYAAKGLPVDVALERIDTLDVMGFGYEASLPVWYRLLNCGFRVPASAGTDCFLNRIGSAPPGWGRCYVRLPGGLDYGAWIAGQKAGRSFISSGPMLEFAVDAAGSGDVLKLPGKRSVRVRARAFAQAPLERLQLIRDGQVVAEGRPSADKLSFELEHTLPMERSGWLAVRTGGPPVAALTVGRQAAHANPVYVEVAGATQNAKADAEYFLAWIARLEADAARRDRLHTGRSHVEMQFGIARTIFGELARGRP
ncbi:MAG: CehA/McbA family metallohydrolase [Verrucomicrobia bacterium]|nr:CehA/McbA family metallohydrolase [Verrucomicrobiota bacterium]